MLFRALSIPVTLVALPALGYAAICVMLFLRQDRMIFFPSRHDEGEFDALARLAGFEPWMDQNGEHLGWKKTRPDAQRIILACHGNGGSAVDRFELGPLLSTGPKFDLYLLEYPGYGARRGKPSEQSLVDAAVSAVDTITATQSQPLWLLGESLGTGVASATAAKRPDAIDGLILLTPFDSLVGAAQNLYPWLPVGAMLRHRFDSIRNLSGFRGPVAIAIAGQDTTTPPDLGRRLAERIAAPSRIWLAPNAGHNDTAELLEPWAEMAAWLDATGRENVEARP